jgi:hypothetical protein
MSTHGGPTVVPPETLLTFRLETPVTISTERSQVAFQPVGQGDYSSSYGRDSRDQDAYGGGPRRRVVAPPPAYPYYYGSPYGWGYPGPAYFGLYGYYGPRVIIRGGGFRGGFRGFRR